MNDFDDILEQPAEQESPAQEKPQRKLEWWQIKEQRQRKEAYSTLDRIFHEFSEGKGDVQGYLDTHGRFDRYSARNALLIHDKCPGATQLGNYKYWENLDAEILKTEKNNPIIILDVYKRQALGEHPEDFLWDCSLWNVFESVCKEELSGDDIILIAARKGVICHNNRLPTLVRIAMERLMRSKSPLIIIASSTLGQGVNVEIGRAHV